MQTAQAFIFNPVVIPGKIFHALNLELNNNQFSESIMVMDMILTVLATFWLTLSIREQVAAVMHILIKMKTGIWTTGQ